MYRNQTARIIYASYQSKMVKIQRGVRQSCPLSSLLFDLVIQMLAIVVRAETDIHGLLIKAIEHKVTLYADDVGFVVCFFYISQ